jgi:oxygen-dependent protoporphyrinogen oxidase
MKIVVLGGGISGLSAAWYLRKAYPESEITLIEKKDRLGGWIHTSFEGGFLFEAGPRTFVFREHSPLYALIQELGLGDEVLFSSPAAQKRYLWHQGGLKSPMQLLPRVLFFLLKEPWIGSESIEDESIHAFATRRFGKKVADTFFDPMTLGIYGGDAKVLSMKACFPSIAAWEEEYGSVVKGAFRAMRKKTRGGLYTLRGGMSCLIDALAQKTSMDIRLNHTVQKIRVDGVVASDTFFPAELIISALPGSVIGDLTHLWPDFPTTHLQVATFVFEGNVLPKQGFGYLVPSQEKQNILGACRNDVEQTNLSFRCRAMAPWRPLFFAACENKRNHQKHPLETPELHADFIDA